MRIGRVAVTTSGTPRLAASNPCRATSSLSIHRGPGADAFPGPLLAAQPVLVNPGQTITYTVNYGDSSSAGWLNGGRPGVTFAFANAGLSAASDVLKFLLVLLDGGNVGE